MALKAGRVGVRKDQVDADGRVKSSGGGLSPQDRAKLDKALVTPSVQLQSNELVGVGTGGEQIRVQLGEGVSLEGTTSPYILKTSGTSSDWILYHDETESGHDKVITLPDNYKEIKLVITSALSIVFSNIIDKEIMDRSSGVFVIGGYCNSTSIFGRCYLHLDTKTISAYIKGGTSSTENFTYKLYYR